MKKSIDERFFIYHKENLHVFDLFKDYAYQAKNAGFKCYSSDAILHRLRWHLSVETKDPDGFKMNNNYSSRYARLLVKYYPEFEGFFRNRKLTTNSILTNG